MFADYRAVVLEDYRRKKDSNNLSLNLVNPTPARIRNECLAVLSMRYSREDEKVLRVFFGARNSVEDYEQTIRKFDIDKFRPLKNLLSRNHIGTDDKNIELLAWLIDFQPRPYRTEMKYSISDGKIQTSPKIADTLEIISKHPLLDSALEKGHSRHSFTTIIKQQKKSAIAFIVLAIIGSYSFLKRPNFLLGEQKCMYWAGDHYQPVPCNEKIPDTRIVALDPDLVDDFRKISTPDTITENSIGKVWYSKIDNTLEFFTADGKHPVHDERQLKPITAYIINKYLTGTQR